MRKVPTLWVIHAQPSKVSRIVCGLLPFVLLILIYLGASHYRHSQNEQDKLLPTVSKMVEGMKGMIQVDERTGKRPLVTDTLASLGRLGTGVGIAAAIGLLFGINLGVFRGLQALLLPFITFISIIPPLAVLPILFVLCGVDELAKGTLIVLGVTFLMMLSIADHVKKLPPEQTIKSLTLGASQLGIVYRVVLPQSLPKLIDAIRLYLGSAWLFLIAAEAIASTEGLGYRIFLMRRYMAMDVIIPYVLWITALGFMIDVGLKYLSQWTFRWYHAPR